MSKRTKEPTIYTVDSIGVVQVITRMSFHPIDSRHTTDTDLPRWPHRAVWRRPNWPDEMWRTSCFGKDYHPMSSSAPFLTDDEAIQWLLEGEEQ